MATPVLNNAFFMKEYKMELGPNLDKYLLAKLFNDKEPMDLGPIEFWAQVQRKESPIYNFARFTSRQVITVDDPLGRFSYKVRIREDLPYVVQDLDPTNLRKGQFGSKFKLKLSRPSFGHGHIISADFISCPDVIITEDPIVQTSDGVIYTCQLVNNNTGAFIDNKFLQEGVRWFLVSSAVGEHSQKMPQRHVVGGWREYVSFIGDHELADEKHITDRAADTLSVYDIEKYKEGYLLFEADTDMVRLSGAAADLKTIMESSLTPGTVSKIKDLKKQGVIKNISWLSKIEYDMMSALRAQMEAYLMWGKGGFVEAEGESNIRLFPGIWQQTNNGYKLTYTKNTFSLELLENFIWNFYEGKEFFNGPKSDRNLVIMAGRAALRLISNAINQRVQGLGFTFRADKSGLGLVTGDPLSLVFNGYFYEAYNIPFLANVKFVHNPALDNLYVNEISNPRVDGLPLSSYSILLFDITDNTDLFYIMKKKHYTDYKWIYQVGTFDPFDPSRVRSVGNFSGFKIICRQYMPAVWVKDPTRIAKMVMLNPITGGSL